MVTGIKYICMFSLFYADGSLVIFPDKKHRKFCLEVTEDDLIFFQ